MTVETRPGFTSEPPDNASGPPKGPSKWRHQWQMLKAGQTVADLAMVAAAALLAERSLGAWGARPEGAAWLLSLSGLVVLACLLASGAYAPRAMTAPSRQTGAALFAALCLGATWWVSGMAASFPPGILAAFALILAVGLAASRLIMRAAIARMASSGQLRRRLALVGSGEAARRIVDHLGAANDPGIDLVGVFDDRRSRVDSDIPLLGDTEDLIGMVRAKSLDCVIVTLPAHAQERTVQVLRKLRTVPVRVEIVAHSALWELGGAGLETSAGLPTITVLNRWVDEQTGLRKRMLDIAVSATALALLWPLMLVIAVLIRLDSPGPALFRQPRYGYNNRIFEVFKFRSMRNDLPPDPEVRQATKDDPRITRIGAFLRKSSLDELPQLLNVLRGDMSIVGPRPHAIPHNLHYGALIDEYFARHNVKPGITGWAQVNGLRGETYSDEDMRCRVASDIHYIENWSLLFDLKIIALTAIRVWFQKTAY